MFDIVVPTIGRPSLARLLESIARSEGMRPGKIFVVDDRKERSKPLNLGSLDSDLSERVDVLAGGADGPAAARNHGWRASRAAWIAFVDDDVVVGDRWLAQLVEDLSDLPLDVAASTGRITVPMPATRRPTDWERNVATLETARWITADCAYRRAELLALGGFDARFRRAFREDTDLALRSLARGKRIVAGMRRVTHPVRPASWSISIELQAGNADDALMDALHGADWRERAGATRGAFRSHVATVAAAVLAAVAFFARKPRSGSIALAGWALQTSIYAWRRIEPGPCMPAEIGTLLITSAAIPFAAVAHRVRGQLRLASVLADRERAPRPVAPVVLLDRDGTLIEDVPFNADPSRVAAMPYALEALNRLRDAGVMTAVVTNQSGIALGALRQKDVDATNARMDVLLGPLGPIFVCPHAPVERCACRKPAPGLIEDAARALGVAPHDCVVIGDIGSDMEAARAAGARAILVATPVTRPDEVAAEPFVAPNLNDAVSAVLGGRV